jgi:hypothetical protein
MEVSRQSGLYRLAKRLSLGRLARYFALWARYLLRAGQSAVSSKLRKEPAHGIEAQAASLARADWTAAKRMAVGSWLPLDLANARLHRAMLASVAAARADLKLTPEMLDCIADLKSAEDLAASVEAMVDQGLSPQVVNTALYVLLLRRLPAPSELPMIASRHPRHALIAIQSGDEYRKQGCRAAVG